MENSNVGLQKQLIVCRNILNKGYKNIQNTRLSWLNTFCLELFKFSQNLHNFLSLLNEKQKDEKSDYIQMMYLCLTQVVTCIKHMEHTIKAEELQGAAIPALRQHFLDRILWCLERLQTCLISVTSANIIKAKLPEERSIVELMDGVLDLLTLYSSYNEEYNIKADINIVENRAQAVFDSQEIRLAVDLVLGHTLAFANVALQEDKKALSALCQKVLRECMAFQEECTNSMLANAPLNDSNRKLKAICLENALYQLEDYLNEAVLRLVFTCFLDFNKFSIEKLRQAIKEKELDDPELDELIADFDVNVDRTTQIGIFAITFAPNVQIKTIVRSCLASLESLDSCIIPSLQAKSSSDIFAKILEQHFNEEVTIFKNSIQEIIDSQAFATCYFELLTQTINNNAKVYNKQSLENILEMAKFLYEHFQLPVNYKEIQRDANKLELLKKFYLILQECQAVLNCTTLQLETQRILKRFRILRSVLRKLIDEISDKADNSVHNKSQAFLMTEDLLDHSQDMFDSFNITPSIISILYNNNTSKQKRRKQQLLNDSIKANCSKLPLTPASVATDNNESLSNGISQAKQTDNNERLTNAKPQAKQQQRFSLRRIAANFISFVFRRKSTYRFI